MLPVLRCFHNLVLGMNPNDRRLLWPSCQPDTDESCEKAGTRDGDQPHLLLSQGRWQMTLWSGVRAQPTAFSSLWPQRKKHSGSPGGDWLIRGGPPRRPLSPNASRSSPISTPRVRAEAAMLGGRRFPGSARNAFATFPSSISKALAAAAMCSALGLPPRGGPPAFRGRSSLISCRAGLSCFVRSPTGSDPSC